MDAVLVPHRGATRAVVVQDRGVVGGLGVDEPGVPRREVLEPVVGALPLGELVVEAHGPVPVGQAGLLDQAVRDVDPEAVDAPVAPEAQDGEELLAHLRQLPVQVGLGGVEDVEVPLARRAVGLGDARPAAATEHGGPVVGGLLAVGAAPVAEDVALALAAAGTGGQGRAEPVVLAARVVGHEVEDDLDAEVVRAGDEGVGVVEAAEAGVDVAVVGDVVAGVVHRRDVEGADPQRVDPEVAQVGQAARDARQVADAVTVGVGPRARVHLVDDGVAPPRGVGGVRRVDDLVRGGHGHGGVGGRRRHPAHASKPEALREMDARASRPPVSLTGDGPTGGAVPSSVLTSMCAARRK